MRAEGFFLRLIDSRARRCERRRRCARGDARARIDAREKRLVRVVDLCRRHRARFARDARRFGRREIFVAASRARRRGGRRAETSVKTRSEGLKLASRRDEPSHHIRRRRVVRHAVRDDDAIERVVFDDARVADAREHARVARPNARGRRRRSDGHARRRRGHLRL